VDLQSETLRNFSLLLIFVVNRLDQGQLALFITLILIKKVVGVCRVIPYPNATFRATLKVTHLFLFSNVTRVTKIVTTRILDP
jgi:hypothetical protein